MKWFAALTVILSFLLLGAFASMSPTPIKERGIDFTPPVSVTEPTPSLKEKVGALFMAGHWVDTPVSQTTQLLEEYSLGGIIIMSAPEDARVLSEWTTAWQQTASDTLLIAIDQEGGVVTRLKGSDYIQTAQPDITTTEEALIIGQTRGAELASLGINTNFAPVVESSVRPEGFLYERVFRDPVMIPDLAEALMAGTREAGVVSTIKHYPGHEDEPADSHTELPIVELADTTFVEHTKSFQELIERDAVDVLMTAHVLVPELDQQYPATLSKTILQGELRKQASYQGVIITDDMTMDAIDEQFSVEEASVLALLAGADMILFAAEPERLETVIPYVLEAIESGRLPESVIDEHYQRVQALQVVFDSV